MPLGPDGYRALRAHDILLKMQEDFEEASEKKVDWVRDTFLGPAFAVIADQIAERSAAAQRIYDSRSPNNAVGTALSDLAAISGIRRSLGSLSVMRAMVNGTDGTWIDTLRIRAGDGDWELSEPVQISGGGSVAAFFQALVPGNQTAVVNETAQILTPALGLSSVVVLETVAGVGPERDPELALRREQSLQVRGSTAAAAIRARILETIAAVQGCLVLERDQPGEVVIEGITMPGHSVAVVIHPQLLPEDEDRLAALLYQHVTSGVQMVGDVSRTIDGTGLTEREARWGYAAEIDVVINVSIRMEVGSPGATQPPSFEDAKPVIERNLIASVGALGMGDDVLLTLVRSEAGRVDGVRSVTSATVASDPAQPSRLDSDGNLIIYASEIVGNITVNVSEV